MTSSEQAEEARRLRRQLVRFQKVVEALKASGALREAQDILAGLVVASKGKSPEQLDQIVLLYSESLAYSLENHGLATDLACWLADRVKANLLEVITNRATVDFDLLLDKVVKDWTLQLEEARRSKRAFRRRSLGFLRLVGAGGAFVFDATKFMIVFPAPTFLAASFVAGAMIFYQGLDQLFDAKE